MNASAALRDHRLRGLGVLPLRLRVRGAGGDAGAVAVERDVVVTVPAAVAEAVPATRIARLALQADPAERRDPAIDKMYTALSEAVSKAGLQPVRVCDVAGDPSAAVLVFGAAPLPEGVPALRVLRTDPLTVLHADRERKRLLWERLQSLGRGGG